MFGDVGVTDARFQTTLWTLVQNADGGSDTGRGALNTLLLRYMPPVYGFLRRSGLDRDRAAEVTQAFFVDVVLSRELFARADASRGRLRSLMLSALKRYMIDQHRREAARGRSPRDGLPLVDFDTLECMLASNEPRSPDVMFDRTWVAVQLNEALRRCEAHCMSSGKSGHWRAFESRILHPTHSGCKPPKLDVIAHECGFRTAADAAAAVQTVKKRIDALLREVVAESTMNAAESASELESILQLLD